LSEEKSVQAIDVVLGFDMETDVGSFSPFYEGLVNGTPKILSTLQERGIEATFFFTGEAAERHPEVPRSILAANARHEIGCHGLYHETYGDPIFDIPGVKPLLPEEVPHRLALSTELVEKAAGVRPVSFRCPRLWGSTAVVNALEELGYAADASYPMYFYEKQIVPYHPSRETWLEEGKLKILEIPNFADMSIDSEDPYKRDRDQWPLFRTENGQALIRHIDAFLDYVRAKGKPAVLCFYFHPWEFIDVPDRFDYGEAIVIPHEMLVKNCGDFALRELAVVLDALLERGAAFKTARGLAEAEAA
jgi:peptidoglycan/xylan/chitin deacetylase (PgdA/CDA1 family)